MTTINKIRAALEGARELIPEYCGIRTQYDAAFAALAELETELSQMRRLVAELQSGNAYLRTANSDGAELAQKLQAEREQLRARLAAIDAAPTVARVKSLDDGTKYVNGILCAQILCPPLGTELIARPEAK